jgi:pimeloyl-ACP methyl ester carboxylesterase
MKQKNAAAGKSRRFFIRLTIILLGILIALFIPWNVWMLLSHPHPIQNYGEAIQRIEALRATRQSEMNPDCLVQLLTHGEKVQHAIILVHGYTNCPAQFRELGRELYDRGFNVLIAPMPHHGLANRLNDEQGQLTAKELTVYADELVDLAHGLERVMNFQRT